MVGNEEDAKDVLGIVAERTDVQGGRIEHAAYESVARQIRQRYGSRRVAITLRESESATVNHWSACLLDGDAFFLSRRYSMHVVDRVGAGDAFCGALLTALLDPVAPQEALEFAVAASCLKHSIPGDFNKVNRDEVLRLCPRRRLRPRRAVSAAQLVGAAFTWSHWSPACGIKGSRK